MVTLYFGTIQGQWNLMLKKNLWVPIMPPLVIKLIQAISPLLLGKDEWLDNRLLSFGRSEGVVFFTDEKETAKHYATTFPEIAVTCLNRFVENLEDGSITNLTKAKEVAMIFKELNAFFTAEGKPLVITSEFPEQDISWRSLNEYTLNQPLAISTTVKNIEPVHEEHHFLYYYKDLVIECAKKQIPL